MRLHGQEHHQPQICVLSNDGLPEGLEDSIPDVTFECVNQEGLSQALCHCDALLLWDYFSRDTRDAWSDDVSISWIHVPSAGVDKLLFSELVDAPVTVTNARGIFDQPISEYVLGLVLHHFKQFHATENLQRKHRWIHRETALIAEKRALVIGTGAIGRAIARCFQAVHINVTGGGRTHKADDPDFHTVLDTREWHEQLGTFDIVVLVCPLTPQTRGLFGRDEFASMKPSSFFINVGRGELVDQNAMVEALRATTPPRISAAIDVATPEPLPSDSELWDLPGLLISPHMSGDYLGWQQSALTQYRHLVAQWLAGEPLDNQVDKTKGYSSVPAAVT